MAELVDAPDSKSGALGRPGSTPGLGTYLSCKHLLISNLENRLKKPSSSFYYRRKIFAGSLNPPLHK
jgi:hypothetical protein